MLVVLVSCARYSEAPVRKDEWAKKVDVVGVKNLYQVSAELYRSEQPTELGMRELEKRGIETVVSLRVFHSDREFLKGTDLNYERITFQTWAPEDDEVIRFLNIVSDSRQTPVLVHCLHGSDRTGAMCAVYRIVVQGWSKEAAINEMKNGGYGHHKIWRNLEKWIQRIDVAALRAKAGPNIVW